MVVYMSKSKLGRIFKYSVFSYKINFKRHFFLTLTIGVSILLFLSVSLYLDFNFATFVNDNDKIQKNYIPVITSEFDVSHKIENEIDSRKRVNCKRGTVCGTLSTDNVEYINVNYNAIVSDGT